MGTAHARPSLELEESSARGGDVVHFTISGVDGWGVAYHFEVARNDVLSGRSKGFVAGTFTMPDLGEGDRTVVLDGELWWADRSRKLKRTIKYLGPALPVEPPAAPPAYSAPAAVLPQAATQPAPSVSPNVAAGTSPPRAVTPESHRGRRQTRERQATGTRRSAVADDRRRGGGQHGRERGDRRTSATPRGSKRSARRARLFPDAYTGPREVVPLGDRADSVATKATGPDTIVLGVRAGLDRGFDAAVVVPAMLALAALALAGTAVLRSRRLSPRG